MTYWTTICAQGMAFVVISQSVLFLVVEMGSEKNSWNQV